MSQTYEATAGLIGNTLLALAATRSSAIGSPATTPCSGA
jgi:hypothetical protein